VGMSPLPIDCASCGVQVRPAVTTVGVGSDIPIDSIDWEDEEERKTPPLTPTRRALSSSDDESEDDESDVDAPRRPSSGTLWEGRASHAVREEQADRTAAEKAAEKTRALAEQERERARRRRRRRRRPRTVSGLPMDIDWDDPYSAVRFRNHWGVRSKFPSALQAVAARRIQVLTWGVFVFV
jgi:hypothetical protein